MTNGKLTGWLKLFRIVNLPTVPGDVFVGAAACAAACGGGNVRAAFAAAAASCFVYLFGLADNDVVGAATDGPRRPIPAGEITVGAARVAGGLCLGAALAVGAVANLPPAWWVAAAATALSAALYNRVKLPALMGAARAMNVLCGAAAMRGAEDLASGGWRLFAFAGAASAAWLAYVWAVTAYSDGEDRDEAKRANVGFLVGAIVYLQLSALVAFALAFPAERAMRPLLIAGAVLLAALRISKHAFPKVSAS